MDKYETLRYVNDIKKAGGIANVSIAVKDDAKREDCTLEVGPADFRATIRFSDFEDLKTKLDAYKGALANARTDGIVAPAKAPKA